MYTLMDKYKILQSEIKLLESRLQPHDTGHINTAIGVIHNRCLEIEEEINAAIHNSK